MTPEQRDRVIAERRSRKVPWHAPPHYGGERNAFLISAACFEHQPVMSSPDRLQEFSEVLADGMAKDLGIDVEAWVVQPNHYHFLAKMDLDRLRPWLGRLHNRKVTQ